MKSWGETGRKVKEGKIERKFIGGRKREIKEELGESLRKGRKGETKKSWGETGREVREGEKRGDKNKSGRDRERG